MPHDLERYCCLPRAMHEATQAQAEFEAQGGRWNDPRGPLFVYVAKESLEECRERFEKGDKYQMMLALRICANHDVAMPRWLSRAYIDAFDAVHNFRAVSWDAAFGAPAPKGAQARALRQWYRLKLAVPQEVKKLHKEMPLDDGLFEKVAKKLRVGKTAVRNAWYGKKPKSVDKFERFRKS